MRFDIDNLHDLCYIRATGKLMNLLPEYYWGNKWIMLQNLKNDDNFLPRKLPSKLQKRKGVLRQKKKKNSWEGKSYIVRQFSRQRGVAAKSLSEKSHLSNPLSMKIVAPSVSKSAKSLSRISHLLVGPQARYFFFRCYEKEQATTSI